jgi:hypothetical protein
VTLQLEESGAVRCDECGPDRRHRIGDVVRVWIDRHGFYLCPEHRADLHRLTAPPVPPEGERGPCEGWKRVGASSWRLSLTDYIELLVWRAGTGWTWECNVLRMYAVAVFDSADAAKLAAEDAARKLLDEALGKLGGR